MRKNYSLLLLLLIIPLLFFIGCNNADKEMESLIIGEYINHNNTGITTDKFSNLKGPNREVINCNIAITTGELNQFNLDNTLETTTLLETKFSFTIDGKEVLAIEHNTLFGLNGKWSIKSGVLEQAANLDSLTEDTNDPIIIGDGELAEYMEELIQDYLIQARIEMKEGMGLPVLGTVLSISPNKFTIQNSNATDDEEDSKIVYERVPPKVYTN